MPVPPKKKTIPVIVHKLLRTGFMSSTVLINSKHPHKIAVVTLFTNSKKSTPRLLCNHFRLDGIRRGDVSGNV